MWWWPRASHPALGNACSTVEPESCHTISNRACAETGFESPHSPAAGLSVCEVVAVCIPPCTRECRLHESEFVHMISSGARLRYHGSPLHSKQRIGRPPSYSCWTVGDMALGQHDSLVAVGMGLGSAPRRWVTKHCSPCNSCVRDRVSETKT